MTSVSIDINALNSLLDNQKKLDDLFDSIFDDNLYIVADSYSSAADTFSAYELDSEWTQNNSFLRDLLLTIKHNQVYGIITLILEVAIIFSIVRALM
jgi:hypothetical protein